MEVVLYTSSQDGFRVVERIYSEWSKVYNTELKTFYTDFSWTSVGTLPILRVNQFLFKSEQVLQVLKHVANIDEGLSPEALNYCTLIEDVCYNKLGIATIYAINHLNEPMKQFQTLFSRLKNRVQKIALWPYASKNARLEGVTSDNEAFELADNAHRLLSELLGEKNYFSSKHSNEDRPFSVDVIVYSYLVEEVLNLTAHPFVSSSLMKYNNLLLFINRMNEATSLNQEWRNNVKKQFDLNYLKSKAVRLGHGKDEEMIKKNEDQENRRRFITLCAFSFFGYLLANN